MFGLTTQKRYDGLQKEYDELKLRLDNCRNIEAENKVLKGRIFELESEIREIKKQLREQTEADLFFVSAKIQKKLLDGEPKENVQNLRLQQMAYQSQLAQMQQQSPYGNSFLSSLGLGAIGQVLGRY